MKPPSGSSGEKFDRRHFGPQKLEITEQLSNTSIVQATEALPDLPMSPSRDVLHHRRKTNKVTIEILENKDEKSEVNGENNFSVSFNDTLETLPTDEIVNFKNKNIEVSSIATTTTRKMSWLPVRDKDLEKEVYVLKNISKNVEGEKVNLTILGLFEMTQKNAPRPEGPSELQAAKLAIDKINKMGLLPKFHLKLHHNDTEVISSTFFACTRMPVSNFPRARNFNLPYF